MTENDKQFFAQLMGSMERRLTAEIQKNATEIQRNREKIESSQDEIQRNGVMLEEIGHNVGLLAEGYSSLVGQINRLQTDIDDVKEKTDLIPVIFTTVQDHSRRLTALEKA